MEPAMFSVASMFDNSSREDENEEEKFVIRDHKFPGMVLHVREFAFHQVNANLLWPGAVQFADWIVEHNRLLEGRRILEVGSGTGALAIFLRKTYELDITTSDYDDLDIESNINFNCELNGISALPHIRHVKQYPNLIKTLSFLFNNHKALQLVNCIPLDSFKAMIVSNPTTGKTTCVAGDTKEVDSVYVAETEGCRHELVDVTPVVTTDSKKRKELPSPQQRKPLLPVPCFLMSWRRRIPKEDEMKFFDGCRSAGFTVNDLGARVYSVYPALK